MRKCQCQRIFYWCFQLLWEYRWYTKINWSVIRCKYQKSKCQNVNLKKWPVLYFEVLYIITYTTDLLFSLGGCYIVYTFKVFYFFNNSIFVPILCHPSSLWIVLISTNLNSCLDFSAMSSFASQTLAFAVAKATTDSFFPPFFPFLLKWKIKD